MKRFIKADGILNDSKWKRNVFLLLRILGMISGVVLFLWFLLPFLAAGILNIGNLTGMAVSLVWLLFVLFAVPIWNWIKYSWQSDKMKIPMGIFLGLIAAVMLLAGVETGCMIVACSKQPAENATAIVLGCRVYGERASLSLVERLEAAYDYLEANPDAACVVSGGQGNGEAISEAECMKRWLIEKGIAQERIYKEENSVSTEENIAFSKQVIEENNLNQTIAIVTSEYHTYRAAVLAEKNGLTYGSASGKTAIWLLPTYYIRELYAILAEWIFR